ncbi:MAG: nucleotidyltransferase domain-containing protein [Bacteroidota bacterium]|nr:nucleotidyltransferase domain-containing protein [Bacteroidota bacterium]
MQKPSDIHVLPLNRTPFKTDFEALAKKIVLKELKDSDCKIFLFGSRVTKENHRFSDMDIGIIPGKNFYPGLLSDLKRKLDESVIPFKVDIVNFATVSEKFKEEALQHIKHWKE